MMSDDNEFMVNIISEICQYAKENGMECDDTIRTVANNILVMLEVSTFNGWKGEKECTEEEQ